MKLWVRELQATRTKSNLVKGIKIPYPNIIEQKPIAKVLYYLDEKIDLNNR